MPARPLRPGYSPLLGYRLSALGYRLSALGSRQVDEKTRSMLDALKAPKRIETSPGAAALPETPRTGSAWNRAGDHCVVDYYVVEHSSVVGHSIVPAPRGIEQESRYY